MKKSRGAVKNAAESCPRSRQLAGAKAAWDQQIRRQVSCCHEVGKTLSKVMSEDGCDPQQVIAEFTRALGTTVAVLRDCMAVANAWDDAEIQDVTAKCDVFGRPVTVAHLALIATEQQAGPRRVLLGDVLRQGLTVQQLATRLRRRSRRTGRVSQRSVVAGVRKLQQRAGRYLQTEGGSNEEIVELVAEQLIQGEVPRGTMAGLIKKLAESKADQKEVLKSAKWIVKRLGQLIRELPSSDRSLESRDRPFSPNLENHGVADTAPPHANRECNAFLTSQDS